MRIAFDSNILVYFADGRVVPGDAAKIEQAQDLYLKLLKVADLFAPIQALGEALHVMVRKSGFSSQKIDTMFEQWLVGFSPLPTEVTTLRSALSIVRDHGLQHWDSVIIAASSEAECAILLSEDMQHGFVWRGLTVINPFADDPHPLLASLL
ncbi:PIN domain-containing protein [Glacieibacterium sp.]|uniref:PIN domain-containing protein n=1 Tax=Glacieibacterium sp. TaxID=2860237 RepID=UPI003B0004A6